LGGLAGEAAIEAIIDAIFPPDPASAIPGDTPQDAATKGEACPPRPGNKDPCKGLREILAEHEARLAQYLNDPISMDNKDFLKNALGRGNIDLFWKIRATRIGELKSQIENFRKLLEECEKRYG
jgi:hypothetical protein